MLAIQINIMGKFIVKIGRYQRGEKMLYLSP